MEKNSYHVIARSDGRWSVKRTGATRASGHFPTRAQAVKTARKLVIKSGGGELIIHLKDGRVSDRDYFDIGPNPVGDKESGIGGNSQTVKN